MALYTKDAEWGDFCLFLIEEYMSPSDAKDAKEQLKDRLMKLSNKWKLSHKPKD